VNTAKNPIENEGTLIALLFRSLITETTGNPPPGAIPFAALPVDGGLAQTAAQFYANRLPLADSCCIAGR
jgi:hypothetical protein